MTPTTTAEGRNRAPALSIRKSDADETKECKMRMILDTIGFMFIVTAVIAVGMVI